MDLKTINRQIAVIGKGELSFKAEMADASRNFIEYIRENGDIDVVNRLMAVLTPINREKVRAYFNHFLPYTWESKAARFGGKSKNKDVVAKKEKLSAAFLADEQNNLWTWFAEQAAAPVAKPKEYEKKIEALVKKALEDKEEHIPVGAVIRAVIKGGASLAEIMAAIVPQAEAGEEKAAENRKAAEEQAAAA